MGELEEFFYTEANNTIMDGTPFRLYSGRVVVEWSYEGEGLSGEWDEKDPDDLPLARFSIYRLGEEDFDPIDDASYCTHVDASTDSGEFLRLSKIIMKYVKTSVEQYESIKRTAENLSWIYDGVSERLFDKQMKRRGCLLS